MKTFIYILITFTLLIGCDKDNNENCIDYETAYVTSVNVPLTGGVNQNLTFEVLFGVKNGCGNFNKFIETDNGNTKVIEIQAKYEGCICTQAAEIKSIDYIFNTQTSGDYEFKFKSGENEFITVNITIE